MPNVGFGNYHSSEAVAGALPERQNSPQQCNYGLYAEQLSGSAFTQLRKNNLRSWLYRILPSVVQPEYTLCSQSLNSPKMRYQPPNPMRWAALPKLNKTLNFIQSLFHVAGNTFLNTYLYQCNQSMEKEFFSNLDGEMLIVPYSGELCLHTELGVLEISPGWIAVIPRGIKFKVVLQGSCAEGYVCENQGLPLTLPELGIIGANGLANPRHFIYPQAAFEDIRGQFALVCKYQHQLWETKINHSPLNVVAWHGNYAPYQYNLSLFNTLNTVSFDHPDPSIFTVLTSPSDTVNIANLDFVIFPARWMVAEHTLRAPYYHRNIMSEFMGLIQGEYDAKKEGFSVGGLSIHNCMTGHGPDARAFEESSTQILKPEFYANTLAFMFESREPWNITEQAFHHASRQENYADCWQSLTSSFIL